MKGIDTFAKVVIEALALEKDMCMTITGEPEHRAFIEAFTAEAYKKGAKYVHVETTPPEITKMRMDHADEQHLTFYPTWLKTKFDTLVKEKWAILSLTGNENPDLLKQVDPKRIGIAQGAYAKIRENFLAAISSNQTSWLVTGIPTDGWAQKVFDDPKADKNRLWEVLHPIYRLNTSSPIETWHKHAKELSKRSGALNSLHFEKLEFKAEGTELSVGLLNSSIWLGGTSKCVDGRIFFPNIPTEEVFTTPDFRKTSGRVKLTRPVLMMGQTIENGWFEFNNGEVTDFGANRGADILTEYFNIDPQARYLGEIALVGEGNPIGSSGLVFHNILFDENASCHIALGNGYTDAVKNSEGKGRDSLLKEGVNVAPVHTDLMFGSPKLDVWGTTFEGRKHQIMSKGRFLLGK